MKKSLIWIIGGVAVIVVVVALLNSMNSSVGSPSSQGENRDTPTVDVTAAPAPAPTPSGEAAATVKEFTVVGSNYAFAPSILTAKKGDTVKIIFKNADGFHDLKIDEFNVATSRIRGGSEATVSFVADKAGSFEYYCSVGEHRAMGMKGTLTVTE